MKGRKPKLVAITGGGSQRVPSPPTWLHKHAAAEWRRVAPELARRKLLAPDVRATLESYCVAVGQVRELEEIMQVEGRTITDPETGVPKRHAAFGMQGAAMREARLLAAELGLTPHRRGVKGEDGQAQERERDGWADLLA